LQGARVAAAGPTQAVCAVLCCAFVQVRQRYLALNAHAASYTWKALGKTAGRFSLDA
jgi:hypothetical protein